MAAYIIFIKEKTTDPEELKIYSQMAPAGLAGFPVSIKALYGKNELLEGEDQPEGIAILEFPTYEEAKAWYENPVYQAAKEHRLKSGMYRSFIVNGVETN
jgi:uncharacterized protein (DUF1330 family)